MSEPQARTEFDGAARGRVRSALRRYMEEHRIGTPTLQYRIIEADRPLRREIPLSTLQRFISGSHHTHDHHVALCHAFVRELPYYGEGRDVAEFGGTLFGFLQGQMQASERDALTKRLASEFAGKYEAELAGESEAIAASLTLSAIDGQPWLHACETRPCLLLHDEDPERVRDKLSARRRIREGVMVLIGPLIYMILRDNLTRQLRMCCLTRQDARSQGGDMNTLQGEAFHPAFPAGMENYHERVTFVPARAREHT